MLLPGMRKQWVGRMASLGLAALVVGCSSETRQERDTDVRGEGSDAGAEAGCPKYPDSGTVRLRRGCPLTIEYGIR